MITVTKPLSGRSAAALGLFDGVHLGHRSILDSAVKCKRDGLIPAVFTFRTESFPRKHGKPFEFLCTDSQKLRLLESMGIEAVYSPDFADIQEMDGETFCREVLAGTLRAEKVFCGSDFRFGRKAGWCFDDLKKFGMEMGFEAVLVDAVMQGGQEVSSTRIREHLKAGEPEKAAELSGRYYAVTGEVLHGKALGRTIDFPTINQPFKKGQLVPRKGVYLSRVHTPEGIYNGITNIGVKPTVSEENIPLAETYLFDFSGDLYGQDCTSELIRFIRPEQKFESITALRTAIAQDCETARRLAESI